MSTRFDVWGRRIEAEIKDKTFLEVKWQLKSCFPFSLIVSPVCESLPDLHFHLTRPSNF